MIELKDGEGTIEKRIPAMLRMFGKYGIDIRKEPILVYPTLHYQNGGLDITADGHDRRREPLCGRRSRWGHPRPQPSDGQLPAWTSSSSAAAPAATPGKRANP